MRSSRLPPSIPPSLDSDSELVFVNNALVLSLSACLLALIGTCQAGCSCSESEAPYAAGGQHVATSRPEARRLSSLGRLGRRSIVSIVAANADLSRRRRFFIVAAEKEVHSSSSSSSPSSDALDVACFGELATGLVLAATAPRCRG